MKTFVRLIRRYVLAAVGIVLLLLFSGVAVLGWLGWQESCRLPQREYSSSEIADSMVETAEGLAFGAERTPQEWMNGYAWAMVLDDVGNIRWSYGLPRELNHAYTPGDIAKFARWYLADYPVFCWTEPYGLFVIGLPKGSLWKYSIYSSPDFALSMVRVLPAAALGLLLLGLVVFFVLGAHNLSVYVKENINFSILISDDMKESDILKLQKKLDKEPFVKETEYISKKQALREQTEAMGTDPQEFLGYNPFTASIEIKLHSGYANSDSIAKIEKKIRKNTDIQEVLYQKDLIDAVNENIRNISLMLLGLAVILTFISFALINNTIRLTIYSKRFLIHTMKLVGASWGFIRRPFLRRNFRIGVLSAVIADAILWGAAYWLVSYEPELIRVITPEVMLLVSVSVLVFGVLITWLCALLSINKYLKMKASTLYYI